MKTKRKVRKDFNPAKEYSVNVEGRTEEVKKEVQLAFYDVGFPWDAGRKVYRFLGAAMYTNAMDGGNITAHLMYGSTTDGCNMTAEEFLELVYEPQVSHIHAELMAQYAEDAKTTDKPWELWEYNTPNFRSYKTGWEPIAFLACNNYRRKPNTKLVHGVEIPDIGLDLSKCEERTDFYVPCVRIYKYYVGLSHHKHNNCVRYSQAGIAYPYTEEGKQAAILHAKAMLGIA